MIESAKIKTNLAFKAVTKMKNRISFMQQKSCVHKTSTYTATMKKRRTKFINKNPIVNDERDMWKETRKI